MEFSRFSQDVQFSGIRRMFEKARGMDDLVNLVLGEPGFQPSKFIVDAVSRNLAAGQTKYTPNAGIPELRAACAEKFMQENGISNLSEKNIMITMGATGALHLAATLLINPGDEVIIPDPAWPNYMNLTRLFGGVIKPCVLSEDNGFRMTADRIAPLITDKTKLIFINSPSNPTGGMLSYEDFEEIAALIRKTGITVISDEPYEKLVYDDAKHVSLASFPDMEKYVITINSFSKTFAMTGFRLGYLTANEDVITQMTKLHENVSSCVSGAFQLAGVEALKNGGEFFEMMRTQYAKNRKLIVEGINKIKGFSCRMPEGAFYAFINISKTGMGAQECADYLLEKARIVAAPGTAFGGAGNDFIRMSFAAEQTVIEKGLERLSKEFGLQ